MFNLYNSDRGFHCTLPPIAEVAEARALACEMAKLGQSAFYRVFERLPGGGERFVTAFSSLAGTVREHRDVTIPRAHF